MAKITGKNFILEALAMRDDVKEKIRINSLAGREPHKTRRLGFPKLIAVVSLLLVLSVSVGAYYVSTLFYAPGYGILKDSDITIYATKEKVILGDFVVDAVTRTADENGSTICAWFFREKEIEMSEEQRKQGIPPDELENVFIIFDDGTEMKFAGGMRATYGFSQYICSNAPNTNTFRLRDNSGNEAEVVLEDISKTEYADIKGLRFDNISMTVIPLSGTTNVFAAELTDKFTLNISKLASNTSLNASFFAEAKNGYIGYVGGDIMLSGNNNVWKYGTVNSNVPSYDMNAERIMLSMIMVRHSFDNNETEYSFIVPDEGKSVDCNITLFNEEGVKFTVKSIKNENGVLICETQTDDNVKNKHRTKARFDFRLGIYENIEFEDEQGIPPGTIYKVFNGLKYNSDGEFDYDTAGFNLMTSDMIEIKPGDEVFIELHGMHYEYQWDKKSERLSPDWWENPAHNLGVIELK